MPRTTFGAAFRAARERLGMTLRDAALAADIDPSLLSRIESGATDPSLSRAARLAAALDVSLDEIVGTKRKSVRNAKTSTALRQAIRLLNQAKERMERIADE